MRQNEQDREVAKRLEEEGRKKANLQEDWIERWPSV
jgi:hypothetical protein